MAQNVAQFIKELEALAKQATSTEQATVQLQQAIADLQGAGLLASPGDKKSLEEIKGEITNIRDIAVELSRMNLFDIAELERFKSILESLKQTYTTMLAAPNAPGLGESGAKIDVQVAAEKDKTKEKKTQLEIELELVQNAQSKIQKTAAFLRTLRDETAEQDKVLQLQKQQLEVLHSKHSLLKQRPTSPELGTNAGDFISADNPYLGGNEAQARLQAAIESYGMSLQNITSIEKDRSSGITRVQANTTDLAGRTENLTLTMDKLGRVNTKVSGVFKTLGDEVARSVAQFAKFMVSATLVYGVLNAVSEQLQIVIDNETELANIAVVLGQNQETLNAVFNAAADAADFAAESINGVLEGYQQAIRATGDVADSAERMRQANIFMTESLVLSKLSTLDQAKSMDILVAALRQADVEIDSARDLLDRWVAVTKIANVDMRTLAESYAIVATVAKSAGIEVGETNNELVGLIAVLAEQTQLTPTETGNALRAVITGLNTDTAIASLRAYGIAVTDVNGEMRDFLDIATELHLAYENKLISDSQLSKISRAIGGGVRRQGQVEVILKNLDRALEVNRDSTGKYGTAEEALTIQTDTLKDAILRLSNAFQELAQTWGTDGGFLDMATLLVKTLKSLVDIANSLSSAVGPNVLGALALGGVALTARGRDRFPFQGISERVDAKAPGFALGGYTGGQWASGLAGAATGIGLAAAGNYAQGNNEAMLANLAGGAIGATIGGVLAGPAGVSAGAVIGSSILDAFVSGITEVEGELVASWRQLASEGKTGDAERDNQFFALEEEPELPTDRELLKILGGGNVAVGGIQRLIESFGSDIAGAGADLGLIKDPRTLSRIDKEREYDEMGTLLDLIRRRQPEAFEQLGLTVPQLAEAGDEEGVPTTEFGRVGLQITDDYNEQIQDIQSNLMSSLLAQMSEGDLSLTQLTNKKLAVGGISSGISSILPGILEDGMVKIGEDFYSLGDAIIEFSDLYTSATSAEVDQINALGSTLAGLANEIERLSNEEGDHSKELANLSEQYAAHSAAQSELIGVIRDETRAREYNIPGLVKLPGELTPEGLGEFQRLLPEAMDSFMQAQFGDSPEAGAKYLEQLKPINLQSEGGFEYTPLSSLVQGLYSQDIVSQVLSILSQQGGMFEDSGVQNPGFINLPFPSTSPMRQQVLGEDYYQLAGQLGELGYSEEVANNIAVYSDKQMELIQRDNTIIQMLLGAIEENTSEMVDGIYNLPTDGSFYVPFTGYRFGYNNDGGFSGGGAGTYTAMNEADELERNRRANTETLRRTPWSEDYNYRDAKSSFEGTRRQHGASPFGRAGMVLPDTPYRDYSDWGDTGSTSLQSPQSDSASILDLLNTMFTGALEVIQTTVTVDITAMFETFLDGELVAQSTKKYLTEEMVRQGDAVGSSITAII